MFTAEIEFSRSSKLSGLVQIPNIRADTEREAEAKARRQFRKTHGYVHIWAITVTVVC